MNKYDVLIVSTACSNQMYNIVSDSRTKKSLDPAQRVFLTLAKELNELGNSVTCITVIPYSKNNVNIKYFEKKEELVDGIKFVYPAFRIGTVERLLDIKNNGIVEVENWIKTKSDKEKVLICDSLVIPLCSKARKRCKANGILSFAYVTDYPSMATNIKKSKRSIKTFFQRIFDCYADYDIRKYDGYIVVAEKLIDLIKPKNRKHIVVEDIAEIPNFFDRTIPNNDCFSIVYGGALCERFGINKLVDAIELIPKEQISMTFYGSGESVSYISSREKYDNRIHYGGVVSYEELQAIQKKADLLINPRPSNEKFAAYSFPSKTTSYMISGTPVLTTRIPGIPEDYYPYLFLFSGESANEMAERIEEISEYPKEQLFDFGKVALEYLINNKGSKRQTLRIINFMDCYYG